MRIFLLTLGLFVTSTALAQQGQEPKRKLLFPKATPTPVATPAGTPAATAASPAEPAELLHRFFEALKADKLDEAYDGLVKNTLIAAKAENLQQLKKRTLDAIDNFGPVKGYEVVETVEIGSALFRQTCISLNEDLPLRWRFYFYRSGKDWKIVDLRVDDGIVELFDDFARSRKK